MISNREWAILLWGTILLFWLLLHRRTRSGPGKVVRAAASPKLLIPFVTMIAWVGLEVWLIAKLIHWNADLTKGAVVWFITAGSLLFGGFIEASKDSRFFRRKAIETLAWPAVVEFYLDLYNLPLLAEVVLQPILAVLVVLPILLDRKEEQRRAKGWAETLLAIVGLVLFGFVTIQIIRGWENLDRYGVLIEFALPVALTVGALPFIFLLALYAAYETVFGRMESRGNDSWLRRARNRLAVLLGLNLRLREVPGFHLYWLRQVDGAPSFRKALHVVRQYRDDLKRTKRLKEEEQRRLRDYAGVTGTDAEGRQLDRREFKETVDALLWASTCMSGWYARESRYRPDMLVLLRGTLEDYGLSDPPGVELHVSPDGQSWYAWRRTITGWCFAIGAAGPPSDEWRYDGPEPPCGFPGDDPSWGPSQFSCESSLNWG